MTGAVMIESGGRSKPSLRILLTMAERGLLVVLDDQPVRRIPVPEESERFRNTGNKALRFHHRTVQVDQKTAHVCGKRHTRFPDSTLRARGRETASLNSCRALS
jgi:hypothetical protein